MTGHAAHAGVDVELHVHAEINDLFERPVEPRSPVTRRTAVRGDLDPLRPRRDPQGVAGANPVAHRDDDALVLAEARQCEAADELADVDGERVQRADEVSDERRLWMLVDLARTSDLLDAAAIHHSDPV